MKTREEIMKVIEILKAELTYAKEEVSSYTSNVKGFKEDIKEAMDMIKTLENRLQELEEEPYIKAGDTFYFMNNMGDASPRRNFRRSGNDLKKLEFGNISKSLGYIKETARMVKMMQRLRLWKEENDPDFIPNWKNPSQQKWYIYKDEGSYETIYANTAIMLGSVHFSSQNIAERAIEEVCKVVEVEQ